VEAGAFINRGFGLRWSADDTQRSHLSSNLDLTVTSYAFLTVPPTFVNGVMDPLFEFRLLKSGRQEVDSPYKSALASATTVARGGAFHRAGPGKTADIEVNAQKLILEPGKRYLLTFNFLTAPFKGTVDIIGPALLRHYALPAAGEAEGIWHGRRTPAFRFNLDLALTARRGGS